MWWGAVILVDTGERIEIDYPPPFNKGHVINNGKEKFLVLDVQQMFDLTIVYVERTKENGK